MVDRILLREPYPLLGTICNTRSVPDLDSPQFAAHSERARQHDDDPIRSPYWSDHAAHGPNPVFRAHGWGPDQPCGHLSCPHHDEAFSERLQDAEWSRISEHRIIQPHQFTAQIRPLETVVDTKTVQKYQAKEPDRRPPLVAELPGYEGIHVLDGHHRILAAQRAQRPIRVEVKSG